MAESAVIQSRVPLSRLRRQGARGSGGLPEVMTDITGHSFSPPQLLADHVVIVLVFKSTECPVCPVLLQRLSFLSGNRVWSPSLQQEVVLDELVDRFIPRVTQRPPERFQQSARLVLFTDATYIVLCPGDPQNLSRIAENAGSTWRNTPFVVDDRNLSITMRLITEENMRLDRGQAIPAIMEYDGANHIVDFGRGPGRYGEIQLLQLLFRRRAQIEADTQHALTHANLLLTKTATIESRLAFSPNRADQPLPSEILEHIISHIPADGINMASAKVSISWYLATLAATRKHLREAISRTEALMCVCAEETVVLDCISGEYPLGTEIRWVPIKLIERGNKEVMKWHNVLCEVVGFKW